MLAEGRNPCRAHWMDFLSEEKQHRGYFADKYGRCRVVLSHAFSKIIGEEEREAHRTIVDILKCS